LGVLLPGGAAAQIPPPGRPGPYVFDLRVATSSIPASNRGRGFDVGGHVYAGRLGAANLGFGVNMMRVSGSAQEVGTAMTTLAPQLSFNFGQRQGWSHLSLGYGRARVGEHDAVPAINLGAGARWFFARHAAFGFDLRYQRLSAGDATPAASIFGVSAGLSLR